MNNLGAIKYKDMTCKYYYQIDKDWYIGTLTNYKITKQYYEKLGYTSKQIALVYSKGDEDDLIQVHESPPILRSLSCQK